MTFNRKIWQKEWRKTPIGRLNIRRYNAVLKLDAMIAYGGPICICCGEETFEFLTIDHVNNDGKQHRMSIGKGGASGTHLYYWLRKASYPKIPRLQVLCFNCQRGKATNKWNNADRARVTFNVSSWRDE